MLKINVNKERELNFEIEIGGTDYTQVKSQLKVIINEVEYGFPAKVGPSKITVNLPPLNKVVGSRIKEGDEADIKLEMIANGEYLTPWQDKVILSNPLVIEAKIVDADFQANPAMETKLIVSEDGAKQTTIVKAKTPKIEKVVTEEDMTNRIFDKISSKLEHLIEEKKPKKEDEDKEDKKKSSEEEPKKEKVETEAEALERLLNKSIDAFKLSENETDKSKKEMTLDEFKKNLNEDTIMKYIQKKGPSNPEVQKIIYDQAKLKAKKDTPIGILTEVMNILNKKK